MPNKHLEHPEDNLFNGGDPHEVLDSLITFESVSTKWDGAPAVIFGHNEGKWFVGTKSVFNKKKVKINYNPADIARNHQRSCCTTSNRMFLRIASCAWYLSG